MKDALLLNADFSPIRVLGWQRAVCLLMTGKVRRVEDYELLVRSVSVTLTLPAVVSLRQYVPLTRNPVKLCRRAVLARDSHTCQYCGMREDPARTAVGASRLTLDHVVPRSRAQRGDVRLPDGRVVSVHSWANVVTACAACNRRKGSRSPEELDMKLRSWPRSPGRGELLRILFARVEVHEEWRPYLPDLAGMRRAS